METDYASSSGSFSWQSDGLNGSFSPQIASVDITHNLNEGTRTFFVVENWTYTYSDPVDGTYQRQGTTWNEVSFNNPTLYMYGDTNGDGQLTFNDDDPPSPPSYTTQNPLVVPVISSGNGSGSTVAASPSNMVPVRIDVTGSSGRHVGVVAVGQRIVADLSRRRRHAALAAASFSYGSSPTMVYLEGTKAGPDTVTVTLLAQNGAEIGERMRNCALNLVQMDIDFRVGGSGNAAVPVTGQALEDVWVGQQINVSLLVNGNVAGANVVNIQWSRPQRRSYRVSTNP